MFMEALLDTQRYMDAAKHFLEMFRIDSQRPSIGHVTKILAHFSKLPYENLSKIIKLNHNWKSKHFRLPDEVVSDHERFKLGGTCFSLSFLLKSILDYAGYDSYILMADMRSGKNTHCALTLKHNDKEYLLDPGYLLSRPLELSASNMPNHVSLVHNEDDDRYSLWTTSGGQNKLRYSFTKTPTGMSDFQKYWYKSFHWMTMHGICLSKRDENGFVYLHNHYLKREGSDLIFKGKFKEEISDITRKYFHIPEDIVKKAELALRDNLVFDKEFGYRVPNLDKPRRITILDLIVHR